MEAHSEFKQEIKKNIIYLYVAKGIAENFTN